MLQPVILPGVHYIDPEAGMPKLQVGQVGIRQKHRIGKTDRGNAKIVPSLSQIDSL